jgi:hypothetical protein
LEGKLDLMRSALLEGVELDEGSSLKGPTAEAEALIPIESVINDGRGRDMLSLSGTTTVTLRSKAYRTVISYHRGHSRRSCEYNTCKKKWGEEYRTD